MSRSDPPVAVRNVLVIDDDRALRGLFTTLLTKKGFTVDTAGDGRVAFDQMTKHSYSVILLDLMMPDVNGFELLERMERDSPLLLKRVIVMTGAAQRQVARVNASTVWDVIRKPFDIDHLVSSAIACSEGKAKEC
jgi:DNA-binding response OmpR family regulator